MISIDSSIRMPAISLHRSDFIDVRLKQFLRDNQIRKWPLDCVVLLRQMKQSAKYGIQGIVTSNSLSENLDAATQYHSKTGHYTILFNRQKFYYPFQKSAHRRLNFTIAHEIGHIVLDHLYLPSKLKSGKDNYLEEREADEFAARLLMPEELLCSFNYYSFEAVAEWLNVSNCALLTRLQRLHRVDLILSRKVTSCTRCGNIRFSSFAAYCGVCGQSRNKGGNGIRRIYYPDEIKMDFFKRSLHCPQCNLSLSGIKGDRCPSCHTSIFNECNDSFHGDIVSYNALRNNAKRYNGNRINAHCNNIYSSITNANKVDRSSVGELGQEYGKSSCSYVNPAYARCCEMCGKPTGYEQLGFFPSWENRFSSSHPVEPVPI